MITRDNVPIIMGAWGSSSTLAVMPVMEKHGVPFLVETSSSPKITDPATPGFDWTFRIQPTSAMEAQTVAPYIVSKLGFHNVAMMNVNNDWGRGAATVFQQVIEAGGGKVVSSVFIASSATDVLPQLTNIKNSDADSLFITTDSGQIATILKQYHELGLKQTVLTSGGSNYPIAVMKLSSQADVEGTYYIMMYIPDQFKYAGDPTLAEWYYNEYQKRGLPAEGMGESYRGFDGASIIAKIIEQAGCKLDPQSLKAAIPQVQYTGLGGVNKFTEASGHQSFPNVYLVQMVNGKMVLPDFQFNK
jgi:branched-chain amino acid transport system substrate-binding protein